MALHSTVLASGRGWRVSNVVCTAGPADRPFEEQHEAACVAAVLGGTFRYRSSQGEAVLSPGAVLLGNQGACFQCRHDHARGDRCVSFNFEPGYLESALDAGGGGFASPCLPPSTALVGLLASLEEAAAAADPAALEEAGLRLAAAALAGADHTTRLPPSASDERLVTAVLRRIERQCDEDLLLSDLASGVGLSVFRLLRSFRVIVGMTPHQYLLRTRLQRAAVRIGRTDLPISRIAYESGFNDLSTFNHRFRRVIGLAPGAYRAARRRSRG
jgi:AraC family transcriptional regulator